MSATRSNRNSVSFAEPQDLEDTGTDNFLNDSTSPYEYQKIKRNNSEFLPGATLDNSTIPSKSESKLAAHKRASANSTHAESNSDFYSAYDMGADDDITDAEILTNNIGNRKSTLANSSARRHTAPVLMNSKAKLQLPPHLPAWAGPEPHLPAEVLTTVNETIEESSVADVEKSNKGDASVIKNSNANATMPSGENEAKRIQETHNFKDSETAWSESTDIASDLSLSLGNSSVSELFDSVDESSVYDSYESVSASDDSELTLSSSSDYSLTESSSFIITPNISDELENDSSSLLDIHSI
ncbi:hypothetical protein EB796_017880 [Bugula neritina]|uniref:Uncharacterized protein n=1 Tax=Bugula neritina TaxID=10212 RepID=A0A7J7JD09_BUGNE|nr:hypothetical protein EB796_017880 [Bugula neritina]